MDTIKRGLGAVWNAWKAFGKFMGDIVGRIFLMLFYLTVALPFGIGARLLSDPLDVKDKDKKPEWIKRESLEATMEVAQRQF
jgi:hypothetical protein